MRLARILLAVVAVVCFGVALSYPIRYRLAQKSNDDNMEQLSALRAQGRSGAVEAAEPSGEDAPGDGEVQATEAPASEETPTAAPEAETPVSGETPTVVPGAEAPLSGETPTATPETEVPGSGEKPTAAPGAEAPASGGMPTAAPESKAFDSDAGRVPTEGEEPRSVPMAAGTGGPTEQDGAAQPMPSAAAETAEPPEEVGIAGTLDGDEPSDAAGAPGTGEISEGAEASDVGAAFRTAASEPGLGETTADGDRPPREGAPPGTESGTPEPTGASAPASTPSPTPGILDLILEIPGASAVEPTPAPEGGSEPAFAPSPTPTPDRHVYTGALPYPMKDRVTLEESAILPELREIYELNHDLVGWLTVPDTVIDYPVVQTEDSDFYLTHDFYGEENINGQIILDTLCDPYTPSYNLVISGHHMKNGSMFGDLPKYAGRAYWESHRFVEFDTLMARKRYVVFASFYSADYDENEEGFRYNADIRYAKEAEQWLEEVRENQLYDTGIDVEFGDEFITLTTCNRARHKNGRFVVVCRRVREGEKFE